MATCRNGGSSPPSAEANKSNVGGMDDMTSKQREAIIDRWLMSTPPVALIAIHKAQADISFLLSEIERLERENNELKQKGADTDE